MSRDWKSLEIQSRMLKNMNMCVDCAMGKIYKSSFPSINNIHTEKRALIHSDIYESMQISSFDGNKYLTIFIDDVIRFNHDFLIPDKKINIILGVFKIFKNLAEMKLAKHIQIIRTDNDMKYQGYFQRSFEESRHRTSSHNIIFLEIQ